ncbi:hypothetical protein C1H46_029239 [Malus baccata]|uniref:Uncharacterized protein n=1 Tax=Malus baccata TaxID=106549 RepID=A0A540LF97_MALBA|nr:hypothetical protein C1H46_029239 [Malus baccata]
MGTTGVLPITPLGPTVSTTPTSLTSSMTHHVLSTQQTHRRPQSSDEAEQSGEASSIHRERSQTKSWKAIPPEVKEVVLHELLRTEEVESLTSKVADLKEQIAAHQSQLAAQSSLMNQIRLALQISGIQFPDVEPPLATTSQAPNVATTPSAGDCEVEDYIF